MRSIIFKRKPSEYELLCKEAVAVRDELRRCYELLDNETSFKLIDSLIYRMKSLEAQYSYITEKIEECKKK